MFGKKRRVFVGPVANCVSYFCYVLSCICVSFVSFFFLFLCLFVFSLSKFFIYNGHFAMVLVTPF